MDDSPRDRARSRVDLTALRLTGAIREAGSLTGAARLLGFSQSAISQQVARVEQSLGIPIVTRAGRTVRLTEAGQLLARSANLVEGELDRVDAEIADLVGGVRGHLRLVAFPSASASLVPRLLGWMRERYRGIEVTFLEEEPPEAARMIVEGAADLALVFSHPEDVGDPHERSVHGLSVWTMFSESLHLVLPTGHRLAGREAVALDELADEDWIAGCPRCRGHLLSLCRRSGVEPRISRETDNTIAVLGMVRAGLGVALLPSMAVETVGIADGIVLRALVPSSSRRVHAVVRPEAARVPAVAAALDGLQAIMLSRRDGADNGTPPDAAGQTIRQRHDPRGLPAQQ